MDKIRLNQTSKLSVQTAFLRANGKNCYELGKKNNWCRNFNAHSTLWSDCDEENRSVIEELMENKKLVCLNNGSSTRINVRNDAESATDATLVAEVLCY